MGGGSSLLTGNSKQYFTQEFERVRKDSSRDYLTLEEVLLFQAPPSMSVDFTHLGTLYLLDCHKLQAKVTEADLLTFADVCARQQRVYRPYEFQTRVEGLGTMKMWQDVMEHGSHVLENWIVRLVVTARPESVFSSQPNVRYVRRESIVALYKVIQPYLPLDTSFQLLFDLMQHAAEEKGLLNVEDEHFDDYVPVDAVAQLAKNFTHGFMSMLKDLGFGKELIGHVRHATRTEAHGGPGHGFPQTGPLPPL
mmetsp:Transcript_3380/g.6394  ORF Transcript_3380/g.6394 Transcript_3380/m.6394 type:complete len:251 (-) Transcript_3380:22-774(-)